MSRKPAENTERREDAHASNGSASDHAEGAVEKRKLDSGANASIDPEKLLSVLAAVNRGDFNVRYDGPEGEAPGSLAFLLNQVVSRNKALTEELKRVASAVGTDGLFKERASLDDAEGGWTSALDSVNSLIDGLGRPLVEIERIVQKAEEIKRRNFELEKHVLERTKAIEATNLELQEEIAERSRAEDEVHRLNAELEVRVRERTAELETANRDLEAFGYTVSHDLRAPLRRIHAFSALLLERSLDKLDADEQEYVRRISASSLRMEQLITDMLDFSSASHYDLRRRPVDLSGMARQILSDLGSADPDHRVSVRVQENVRAVGDQGMLRMVMENLIDNAWKFSARRPNPAIEFASTSVDGQPVYLVRDNGVGFDVSQAEVLFDPFRRLHGDYEGAGIGLSTVKRIISRHGGRIWADSEEGKGATFFFTLGSIPGNPGVRS